MRYLLPIFLVCAAVLLTACDVSSSQQERPGFTKSDMPTYAAATATQAPAKQTAQAVDMTATIAARMDIIDNGLADLTVDSWFEQLGDMPEDLKTVLRPSMKVLALAMIQRRPQQEIERAKNEVIQTILLWKAAHTAPVIVVPPQAPPPFPSSLDRFEQDRLRREVERLRDCINLSEAFCY